MILLMLLLRFLYSWNKHRGWQNPLLVPLIMLLYLCASDFSSFSFIMALSLFTLNMNGLRNYVKHSRFLHWVFSLPSSIDVVVLQELLQSSQSSLFGPA